VASDPVQGVFAMRPFDKRAGEQFFNLSQGDHRQNSKNCGQRWCKDRLKV
jgi:hypothetical protein